MKRTILTRASFLGTVLLLSGCSQVLRNPSEHSEVTQQLFEGAINGLFLWGLPLIALAYAVLFVMAMVRIPFLARRNRPLFFSYYRRRRLGTLISWIVVAAIPFAVSVILHWRAGESVMHGMRLTGRTMGGSIHAVVLAINPGGYPPLEFYVWGFLAGLLLSGIYVVRELVTDTFESWVAGLTPEEIRELGKEGIGPPNTKVVADAKHEKRASDYAGEAAEQEKKSDKARRREEHYAREMAKIDETTSQKQLTSIVLNTQRRTAVRVKALGRITDPALLGEIYAKTAPTDEIRTIIQERWPEVADRAHDSGTTQDDRSPVNGDGPIAFREATGILRFSQERKANFETRKQYDVVITKKELEPYKDVFFLYRESELASYPYLVVHTGSHAPMAAATFGTKHSATVFRACFPDKDPGSDWDDINGESVVTDYAPEGYEITDYSEFNALKDEIRHGYYRVERPQATQYWDWDNGDEIVLPQETVEDYEAHVLAQQDEDQLEVQCSGCIETFTTPNREGGSLQCPHCHAAPTDETRHAYPAEFVQMMWGAAFAIVDCPCPECGKLNRAVFVPPDKVWASRYAQTLGDEDGAYRVRRSCHYCEEDFNIAFD